MAVAMRWVGGLWVIWVMCTALVEVRWGRDGGGEGGEVDEGVDGRGVGELRVVEYVRIWKDGIVERRYEGMRWLKGIRGVLAFVVGRNRSDDRWCGMVGIMRVSSTSSGLV